MSKKSLDQIVREIQKIQEQKRSQALREESMKIEEARKRNEWIRERMRMFENNVLTTSSSSSAGAGGGRTVQRIGPGGPGGNGSGSNYYNDHTNTYVNNDYLIHHSVNDFHIKRPDSVYLSLIKTKDLDIDSIRDIFHDKIVIGTNRTHNISEIKEIIFIFTEKLD